MIWTIGGSRKPWPAFSWKLAGALTAVYFVWGSTYLAIKVVVAATPPLLAAAVRFLSAGILLYAWSRYRKEVR